MGTLIGLSCECGCLFAQFVVVLMIDINFNFLDKIAGVDKVTWQSLVGAALTSYHKMLLHSKSGLSETSNFMCLAKRFKSSSQVLSAVADFLDSMFW